jgi:hypothetical protein
MPNPMQIAIAISLCDVIHREAPVELGLRAANRIGLGRRPCQECSDRAVERIPSSVKAYSTARPPALGEPGIVFAESRRRVRHAGLRRIR